MRKNEIECGNIFLLVCKYRITKMIRENMKKYQIALPINTAIYAQLAQVTQNLSHKQAESLAKSLAEAMTALTCDVLQQAFGILAQREQDEGIETERTLAQIYQALHKYMPWALSFFSNSRLQPMAKYMLAQFKEKDNGQVFLQYSVNTALVEQLLNHLERLYAGEQQARCVVFAHLIEVIDLGVTTLVREPKKLLQFNFVVDKTLNGVIAMTTSLGYKRIEKLAQKFSLSQAQYYAQHLQQFIVQQV